MDNFIMDHYKTGLYKKIQLKGDEKNALVQAHYGFKEEKKKFIGRKANILFLALQIFSEKRKK